MFRYSVSSRAGLANQRMRLRVANVGLPPVLMQEKIDAFGV
jgi:hypothetical protein